MKKLLKWTGRREGESEWFPAHVPGNIQHDYGVFKGFGDIHYGKNVDAYRALEQDTWFYHTEFNAFPEADQHIFFVAEGIDYECEIFCNQNLICRHEGMFSKIELDLTGCLARTGNILEIKILPHPTSGYPRGYGREEANQCCKPAVGYGWDWHPRLLSSGLWQKAWIELRDSAYIRDCSVSYQLNTARDQAEVTFDIDCDKTPWIRIYDQDGCCLYQGTNPCFVLKDIRLWWCNGQGEPYLYRYQVDTASDEKWGYIGFRTIELVMNDKSWEAPASFPKSRSTPPATICLNGRKIFAKGSNWLRPELFAGTVTEKTYIPLLQMAKESHMNMLRCWGGAEVHKEAFYDLCDQLGIMVWQEFPLACNAYPDDTHYLKILEQEARAIIKRLRLHPSVVLWCGGNELFNNWSGMTDQSLPLRLLNSLCYELDRNTPFIMTSPLMGMGHGGYLFRDCDTGNDVFTTFMNSTNTAYTEFGVPGAADPEYLKTFIPEAELFPPEKGGAWEKHHAFGAWFPESWLHLDILERYFGKAPSLEMLCIQSQWLQSIGCQVIFEEARRQWPTCSMALNWCYNEPWKTAVNNSLISYPYQPKPSYRAVADALRPVMPSARIPKFNWQDGELFWAELWLLNDSPACVQTKITAYLELDGKREQILEWDTGICAPNQNKQGHRLQWRLPKASSDHILLILESGYGNSIYRLLYRRQDKQKRENLLNQ